MVARAPRSRSPHHLGVSLSATELCVSYAGSSREPAVKRLPLEAPSGDGAGWPSLVHALTQLKADPGGESLSISLMPPLAEVRVVDLPPLREHEAEAVLSRAAGRYFVQARQAQIVGVARPAKGRASAPAAEGGMVAAAAPAQLVASIQRAATAAGFAVQSIGPAESAWAAAAVTRWPALKNGLTWVVVAHPDRTDLLQLSDARLVGVRRFRAASIDSAAIAAAVSSSPAPRRAGVLGDGSAYERIVIELSKAAVSVTAPEGTARGASSANWQPDALAAEYAAPPTGPIFRTQDARAAWRANAWRATWLVAAAAVLLFVAGAGLQLWGVYRQLGIVRAQRAALAPRLSATLIGRTSVEAVYRNIAGLNGVERAAPTWSQTIANLTEAIPDSAHLTAFRTRGDSLIVEGLADQAADVFNAIEGMPELANVRAGAPVRRQLQNDTMPQERFTIVAVRSGAPAPPVSPAAPAKVQQ